MRRKLEVGLWAATLSGIPPTLHALARNRDPPEATKAAGAILRPAEQRTVPLLLASLARAVARRRCGPRDLAVDLGLLGRRFPRVRALPLGPQVADHLAYGAVAGSCSSDGAASGTETYASAPSGTATPIPSATRRP